jgi:hypothetical protein
MFKKEVFVETRLVVYDLVAPELEVHEEALTKNMSEIDAVASPNRSEIHLILRSDLLLDEQLRQNVVDEHRVRVVYRYWPAAVAKCGTLIIEGDIGVRLLTCLESVLTKAQSTPQSRIWFWIFSVRLLSAALV